MRSRIARAATSSAPSRPTVDSPRSASTVGRRSAQVSPRSKRCYVWSRSRRRRARLGFTLIELLVVIAIIATLASVIAPSIFGNVGESRRSAAKSQIQILSLALDAYRLDNDSLPTTQQGL